MVDLLCEDVVTGARAARYLNEVIPDAQYNPTTLWRWMKDGRLSESGERVFLEHARLGRKFVSSKQALGRFAQRLADRRTAPFNGITRSVSGGADPKLDLLQNGFFATTGQENMSKIAPSRETNPFRKPA
jgi:hypothetical protein